jgi:hypothetical protein
MTQRALEFMSKQGRGHVVTITTSLVDQPMSSVPAALASLTKGALSAATKALAIDWRGHRGSFPFRSFLNFFDPPVTLAGVRAKRPAPCGGRQLALHRREEFR